MTQRHTIVTPASPLPVRANASSARRRSPSRRRLQVQNGCLAGLAFGLLAISLAGCPATPADLEDAYDDLADARAQTAPESPGSGNTGNSTPAPADTSSSDDASDSTGDATNTGSNGGTTGGGTTGGGSGSGDGGQDNDDDDDGNTGSGEVVFDPNPTPDSIPPQTPPTLPAGPLTIATLGDSLTEGSGDESPEGGGYPFRLLSTVQARRPGSDVINLGHSGWSSTDLISGLDDVPGELEQAVAADPDIACVWIGSNDLWALYAYGPEDGTTPDLEEADLRAFAANIDTILARLKATGAALYIGLSDDQSLRPSAGTALYGITPAELAQMSRQIIRYNNVMIAAAKRHGATVVDFYRTTFFTDPATLDPDGIHPNAAGYDLVQSIWWAAMSPAFD